MKTTLIFILSSIILCLSSIKTDLQPAKNLTNSLAIDSGWEWNTFMGSWLTDRCYGIAVDNSGNVYITGYSSISWGSPLNDHAGGDDVFIVKLNSSGTLEWNTFIGGSGDDEGNGIVLDDIGNVYITGESNATWGSPVSGYAGGYDVFAAKLDIEGALSWNTFIGNLDTDRSHGVAVDGSGNIYVTGASQSTWASPINAHSGGFDAFIIKLDSTAVREWNTFMGGFSVDVGNSIAVDGNGNVYATGYSTITWGSPRNAHAGGIYDAFAVKLNSSGDLLWNTFIGSSSTDYGNSIAIDNSMSNIYVVGQSDETWGSPENDHSGGDDAFVAKLNSNGILQWNTFMGNSDDEFGKSIAVNGSGNVYIAGHSTTTWGLPINAHAGGINDAFAAKLNSSGDLLWNTFIGGSSADYGECIAVDGSSKVYVAGYSSATWGSPINAHAGLPEAFAVKFDYSNVVNVEMDLGLPTEFILSQNYPNPFNPETNISFSLPREALVKLKVYNTLGEELVQLVNGLRAAGIYQVRFNANKLTSGVYFYQLEVNLKEGNPNTSNSNDRRIIEIKKMVYLK